MKPSRPIWLSSRFYVLYISLIIDCSVPASDSALWTCPYMAINMQMGTNASSYHTGIGCHPAPILQHMFHAVDHAGELRLGGYSVKVANDIDASVIKPRLKWRQLYHEAEFMPLTRVSCICFLYTLYDQSVFIPFQFFQIDIVVQKICEFHAWSHCLQNLSSYVVTDFKSRWTEPIFGSCISDWLHSLRHGFIKPDNEPATEQVSSQSYVSPVTQLRFLLVKVMEPNSR